MSSVMSVLLWVSGGLVTGPHTDRAWWLIDKAAIVSIGHSSLSGWWPVPGPSPWGQPSQSEDDEAVVCSKWAGGGRAFTETSYYLWKVWESDRRLLAFRISILARRFVCLGHHSRRPLMTTTTTSCWCHSYEGLNPPPVGCVFLSCDVCWNLTWMTFCCHMMSFISSNVKTFFLYMLKAQSKKPLDCNSSEYS